MHQFVVYATQHVKEHENEHSQTSANICKVNSEAKVDQPMFSE